LEWDLILEVSGLVQLYSNHSPVVDPVNLFMSCLPSPDMFDASEVIGESGSGYRDALC
jgi:hypothetical protein